MNTLTLNTAAAIADITADMTADTTAANPAAVRPHR